MSTSSILKTPRRSTNAITPETKGGSSKQSGVCKGRGRGSGSNKGRRVNFVTPLEDQSSVSRDRLWSSNNEAGANDLDDLAPAMANLSVGGKFVSAFSRITPVVKESFHEEALKATDALKRAERGLPNDFLNEKWSDIKKSIVFDVDNEDESKEADFTSDDDEEVDTVLLIEDESEIRCREASPHRKSSSSRTDNSLYTFFEKGSSEREKSFHEEAMEFTTALQDAESTGKRSKRHTRNTSSGSVARYKSFHEEAQEYTARLNRAEQAGKHQTRPRRLRSQASNDKRRVSWSDSPSVVIPSPHQQLDNVTDASLEGEEHNSSFHDDGSAENSQHDISTLLAGAEEPDGEDCQAPHTAEASQPPPLPNAFSSLGVFLRLSWMMGRN